MENKHSVVVLSFYKHNNNMKTNITNINIHVIINIGVLSMKESSPFGEHLMYTTRRHSFVRL